jgi:hypothetical protein
MELCFAGRDCTYFQEVEKAANVGDVGILKVYDSLVNNVFP